MTYYIKGGSKYNEPNSKVWVGLFLGGFPDADYLLTDWKNLDDKGHETTQDPFWRLGGSSGGAKELELGLWNDYRIKFETAGITYWDGDSWEDLLAEGGASNLSELSDVVITDVTDNELLTWNNGTSKWTNQTAAEAGLAVSGHNHAHNNLTGLNDGVEYEHISADQKNALHTIYSLEAHNNDYHNPDYKPDFSENSAFNKNFGTGGTEVCIGNDARLSNARTPTAHVLSTTGPHTGTLPWTELNKTGSNLTDLVTRNHAGLSDHPANAHHVAFVQGDADALYSVLAHIHDSRYYTETEINTNIYTKTQVNANTYTRAQVDAHNWEEADITDLNKYTQAQVNAKDIAIGDRFDEQSNAFPGSPVEGDLHYDEDDDSLYRYSGEALAWIEVGVGGGRGEIEYAVGFIGMFKGTWVDNVTMKGWYACIGANSGLGVPDLERKFVRGAATSGGGGGSDDAVVVQHNHGGSAGAVGNHVHGEYNTTAGDVRNVKQGDVVNMQSWLDTYTAPAGGHGHNLTINNSGESGIDKNIPVFYELIYIMRVS